MASNHAYNCPCITLDIIHHVFQHQYLRCPDIKDREDVTEIMEQGNLRVHTKPLGKKASLYPGVLLMCRK